jgi:hypothetical protein
MQQYTIIRTGVPYMFICHKCGYEDFSDKEKTSCPICGANIIVPKSALVLFLSLVSFIIFTFISFFNDKLSFMYVISIIVAFISLPFAIIEAINNSKKTQDGFKAPDYPSEVKKGSARVPDFEQFGYVCGLKNDSGIKKIMIEVYKEGLNLYHKKLNEILTINYSDIVGIELHSDIEIKQSNLKSLMYAGVFSAVGGLGAGLIGGMLGGIKAKDIYFLELQFKDNGNTYSIYLSDKKSRLLNLASKIEDKVNSK